MMAAMAGSEDGNRAGSCPRGVRQVAGNASRWAYTNPAMAATLAVSVAALVSCSSGAGRETDDSQITSATQVATAGTDTAATASETMPETSESASTTAETTGETTGGETTDSETTAGETTDSDTSVFTTSASDTDPFTTSDSDTNSASDSDSTGPDPCNEVLMATIRDMQQAHPDFETFTGDNAYPGIVESELGDDGKPVYAHPGGTEQTTGPGEFFQWYHDVPGVNQAIDIQIPLTEIMPGVFSFDDPAFFPIDNQGWGNEGNVHNYHFTTEIHMAFTYKPGQVFTFIGDDDLWTFINGKLAIDLGGLHPALTGTVDLDAQAQALGLTPGETYAMDIFHAERHREDSNFRIDTTIDCFIPQ